MLRKPKSTRGYIRKAEASSRTRQSAYAARRAAAAPRPRAGPYIPPSRSEWKQIDTYTGSIVADTTGALGLVNGCIQGADRNNRVGREITMRSIQVTGLSAVTSATGLDQTHRVLLVYDSQPNGTALTVAQVLDTTGINVTLAQKNRDGIRRFTILLDRLMRLNSNAEPGGAEAWRYYRRCNLPVRFNSGNAGTVADIETGSLYLISLGSLAAGATAGTFVGTIRVLFEDK